MNILARFVEVHNAIYISCITLISLLSTSPSPHPPPSASFSENKNTRFDNSNKMATPLGFSSLLPPVLVCSLFYAREATILANKQRGTRERTGLHDITKGQVNLNTHSVHIALRSSLLCRPPLQTTEGNIRAAEWVRTTTQSIFILRALRFVHRVR